MNDLLALLATLALAGVTAQAAPFEGRITAASTRGAETLPVLYTVGSNSIRIEVTGSTYPYPINIVDRKSGALTMVYPHNRSFMRLKAPADLNRNGPTALPSPPAFSTATSGLSIQSPRPLPNFAGPTNLPALGLPPGIGPQAGPGGTPAFGPGTTLPMMTPAMVPLEKIDLAITTNKAEIVGYPCTRYDAKGRGETFEIWATDKLFPFQPYVQSGPPRFGPRLLEDQWPDWLKSRSLFPLRASLRFENGPERFHFEVQSIKPETIRDLEGKLFQPPSDYHELEQRTF